MIFQTQALAQGVDRVVLGDMTETVSLSRHAYVTEDARGELSAQDVVQRFRNNIRGSRNELDYLRFPLNSKPYWLVFEVRNNSVHEDWFLELGRMEGNRSGLLTKLLVYEGLSRKVFYDGFGQEEKTGPQLMRGSAVSLDLPRGKQAIIVMYIVPADDFPVTLSPSLVRRDAYMASHTPAVPWLSINGYIPFLFVVCAAAMMAGFIYTQSLGFIPFIFYYLFSLFWFLHVEYPVFSEMAGVETLASVHMLIVTLLFLTGCFLTIPPKTEISAFRAIVIFAIGLTLVGMVATTVVIAPGSIVRTYIGYTVGAFNMMVGIVFLLTNMTPYNRMPIIYMAGWLALFFMAHIIRVLSAAEIIPYSSVFINTPYWAAIVQTILVYGGVVETIRADNKRRVADVIKKAQKAQTLLKAKQSKEASDQSRLLRVIEREREIMEELRGREAERTEEMRKAKIAADEANNAKSAFLAVVSHEIRTPMTGIMGMMRLMEDTDMSPEQREYANTIKDSGDAMLALLNDILDFSKIQGGGMELEFIEFDLSRVLNGVMMLMKGHADQKQIALILDVDQNVPNQLMGDPTRLRQIFLNLVGNALKFTTRGHVRILVKVDTNHPAYKPDDGQYALYFAVEDTGIGISAEAQKNLFTPFSQADSSIARKYGGTGLGLAICKRLIEAMGAEIQLFSHEGKGTTFHFTLPMPVAGTGADTVITDDSAAKPAMAVRKMRFLIVDDNAINRKVVSGLLSRDGHKFETAGSGRETIDMIEKDAGFDAIFLDIELPDMNGMEVAGHIRNNPETAGIALVALTGNVLDKDIAAYRDAGMEKHIPKPIDPDYLRRIISELENDGDGKDPAVAESTGTVSFDLDEDDLTEDSFESAQENQNVSSGNEPASMTSKLLDEEMLKGLRDGLGASQTRELIQGLFEKSDEIIPQMETAYTEGDRDKLRARAHELKGMAGNFGLAGVSEKAAMIERICRDEETPLAEAKDYIELLLSANERSKIAVDKFIGEK